MGGPPGLQLGSFGDGASCRRGKGGTYANQLHHITPPHLRRMDMVGNCSSRLNSAAAQTPPRRSQALHPSTETVEAALPPSREDQDEQLPQKEPPKHEGFP